MSFQETFSALRTKNYQKWRVEVETGREGERKVNLYWYVMYYCTMYIKMNDDITIIEKIWINFIPYLTKMTEMILKSE